jgi:hypothetical protein
MLGPGMTDTLHAPTNLIALRDGKLQAEALITARFAEGLIDQDELERRLEAVQDAETLAMLERLIVDLVDPGSSVREALLPSRHAQIDGQPRVTALARLDEIASSRSISVVFGSSDLHGRWTPARHNRVVNVFAESVLDLREATLGPGETVFELRCVFASTTILVPPGLAVRVDASVLLGEIDRERGIPSEPAIAGDPVVVITGRVMFAELDIEERLAGEGKRDARRRRKQQRKQRRRQRRAQRHEQRALPGSERRALGEGPR